MKKIIAISLLGIALIGKLINLYSLVDKNFEKLISFGTTILFITGLLLLLHSISFKKINKYISERIFDPEEWEKNTTLKQLVYRLRIRAVLFNNIAIATIFAIVLVILIGFYLLVIPPTPQVDDSKSLLPISLTIRIGSSVLLIFLVGILFRVFKYLLRVAAFYHSKADAIEFSKIKPDVPFDKLIEIFTPEKYDISDLDQSSIASNIVDLIKAKLGKP